MNITQEFYDNLAIHYSKLFQDIQETMQEQAEMLDKMFSDNGYDKDAKVLDCACGIGTQTLAEHNGNKRIVIPQHRRKIWETLHLKL